MKTISTLLLSIMSVILFSQNKYERYNVKTGRVVYKIEKNKETTIKTIVFKDWGAEELIVENTKYFTNKKKNKIEKEEKKIIKLDKGFMYYVDEENKQLVKTKNYYWVWQKDKNMADHGKVIAENFGGEKIGEQDILGYKCEIWKLKGIVTYNYKGVMLKSEAKSDPEIAIKAEFDIPITEKDVALPDYPIMDANPFKEVEDAIDYYKSDEGKEEAKDAWEDVKNMTWEDWYRLHADDDDLKGLSEEEIHDYWNKKKDEHIEERIEERKQEHLRNIPHWPTW